MPILIKSPKWSQTESEIFLAIPLKVGNPSNVNIFSHANFIKINYSPYYFEAFLTNDVLPNESKCKILKNEVKLTFKKALSEMWNSFEQSVAKTETTKSKNAIIASAQIAAQNEDDRRIEKACTVKRQEISKEVERETRLRKEIDAIYEGELKKTMNSIKSSKNEKAETVGMVKASSVTQIVHQPVRNRGVISIDFSERKFPTPQRESQEHAEAEWLQQQHLARKTIGKMKLLILGILIMKIIFSTRFCRRRLTTGRAKS